MARGKVSTDVNLKVLVPYFLGGLYRVPGWIRSSGCTSGEIAIFATSVLLHGIGHSPKRAGTSSK